MAEASTSAQSMDDDRYIQAGDLVIVFASRDKTPIPLTVTPGEHVSNMFGNFAHDDMLGMPYGSKMVSKNGRGYVYLLRPTPELWTLALPHRTQILYAPDMSFISMKLNMGPGSRVIEAGTGSGSFSHVIARTVGRADGSYSDQSQVPRNWKGLANDQQQSLSRGRGQPRDLEDDNGEEERSAGPTSEIIAEPQQLGKIDDVVPNNHGRLWSFEFHKARADKARTEFAAHGMNKVIVLNHRNVCKDGFGILDGADAIFLDLPAPWEAIGSATQALRRHSVGRICCFSPCIEQVLKTVSALTEHGFTDIETFESLVRTHESLTAVGPEMSIDDAITRIKVVEKRKEARRLTQIEKARGSRPVIETMSDQHSPPTTALQNKRKHNDTEETESATDEQEVAVTKKQARLLQFRSQQQQQMQAATVYSRPFYEMKGHTSYLTFATLLPRHMASLADSVAP